MEAAISHRFIVLVLSSVLYPMTNKAGWEIVYFYHAEEDYKKYESNQLAIIHEVKLQLAGKFAGFSCSNTEGACKDKNLGGSCEVNGDTGVCTGSLTNDWKWNCKCTISKKSS
jgi:hypothetical protein